MSHWLDSDPLWRGLREERLEVNGHPVRVIRADSESSGGAPQLLVHGLGGSAANWIDVIGPLTAHGPVVAVDLPGSGGTPVPDGGSARVGAAVAFIRAVARTLGWHRYALYGNSFGGLVATLVAAGAPEEVTRLVLVAPALPPSNPVSMLPIPRATAFGVLPLALPVLGPALATRALGGRDGAGDAVGPDANAMLELLFGDGGVIRASMRQALAADAALAGLQPAEQRGKAITEAARSMAAMWLDPREAHAAIDAVIAPTLLLGGDADPLIPDRVLRSAWRRRPDWTTWIASGVGHVMMLERPDRFVAEVDVWTRSLTTERTRPAQAREVHDVASA